MSGNLRAGQLAYAALFIWLGVLGLQSHSLTAIWSGVPEGAAYRPALVFVTTAVCLVCGLALLWHRTRALGAGLLAFYLVFWMLAFRLPLVLKAPTSTLSWWVTGETAVMFAGALTVLTTRDDFATAATGLRLARVFYGLGLIPFGVAHFTYFAHTVDVVPHWMPWREAWAAITGGAFIAAGVAIVTGVFASLAAALSAWMMGLFTLIVWVPIIVRGHPSPGDWLEFVDSCALTAAAWVVAESWQRRPR